MPEPTPCDLLIVGGTVLDLGGADGPIDARVAVAEDVVATVGPGEVRSTAEAGRVLVRSHS